MKNLLALAAAALIVFAVVGWRLGWYDVSRTTDPQGHQKININVDPAKVSADVEKAAQKVREMAKDNQPPKSPTDVAPPPALPHMTPGSDQYVYPAGDPPLWLPPDRVLPAEYQPRREPPP